MDLSPHDADTYVEAYRDEEPLYMVESEAIETLPAALRAGEYGRRDTEWVVRWYFRRFLGAYPDRERRRVEDEFVQADFERVRDAIETATTASGHEEALDALTTLPGVDVPVGSAFLMFVDPDRYIAVGEREWRVVRALTDVDEPYPDPPTVDEYGDYLDACVSVADDLECSLWELYMVFWRAWKDHFEEDSA
jgi:hypothetical protein